MKTNSLRKQVLLGGLWLACTLTLWAGDEPVDLLQLAFPGAGLAQSTPKAPGSPLTLAYGRTWGNPTSVEVVFSAPVAPSTATNKNNYAISGGVVISRAAPGSNSYSVQLTTATPLSDSVVHVLTVNNVQDQSTPPSTVPANSQTPILKAQGVITRKLFTGLPYSGLGGLTNHAKFPNMPDVLDFQVNAELPQNSADSYGGQLVGFVHPPVTGDYAFFLSADEQGALFLSPDENPLSKALVASVPSAAGYRSWLTFTNQQSSYVRLEAGRRYYLEALMAEGGGADHLSVTWRMRGMLSPNPGDAPIPGAFLSSATPSGPVRIEVQPQSQTVAERGAATFTVVAGGTPPYTYQWSRDGLAIPDAAATNYGVAGVTLGDSGSSFAVVVSNAFSRVTSSGAILTVAADTTPPTISRLSGGPTLDRVLVNFSEAVTLSTAWDVRNYSLSGGLIVHNAELLPDQTNVILSTSLQVTGRVYTLTVAGVTDTSGSQNAANISSNFTAWVPTRGFVRREAFYGNSGGTVADLLGMARFPDVPDAADYMTATEAPNNIGDNSGQRLVGLLLPPTNGYYKFYLATADQGALYLSTDASPASKVLIATEPVWNSARYWVGTDRRNAANPENRSLPIYLQAGRQYYFEALMKDVNSGNSLGFTWQLPGAPPPNNGDPPIQAPFVAAFASPVGVSLVVTQEPQNTAVLETAAANFTVGVAASSSPVFYQWQKNGVDLPGANSPTYTTPRLFRGDDGARFRCFVSIPGASLISAEATVSVTPDTQAPQALSAATLAGSARLGLCFSELIDPAGATNPANYTLSYGAAATGVTLQPDGQSVSIGVAALCLTNFTARLNNLKDLSGNALPANTTVPVTVLPMESLDVGTAGDPAVVGSTYTCAAGAFDMVAGGSYIWNNADHFQFACEQREGDFDVQVRIARLDRADHWSGAGIMARENLTPGSRYVWGALNTPAGANQYGHSYRAAQDGSSAGWPGWGASGGVPLPNAWLRLQRVGDIFTVYRGTNGVDWTQFGQISNNLPSRLLVGLGACANNNGGSTTVWFRDYGSAPAPLPAAPVDLEIKGVAEPGSAWAMNNAYQLQPAGAQVRLLAARTNAAASFLVRIENDATEALSPVVRAAETSETNWTVIYRDGASDISSQVRSAGGYTVSNLLAGGTATLSVELLPNGRALGSARKTAAISVFRNGFLATPRDVVQAVAFNEPVFRPDLMVRRLSDVVYTGDNVYNATGAGQTKSQKIEPATPAVYPLLLANEGNLTNYYTVRATAGGGGWSARYFDAVSAGADLTGDMTGGGAIVALPPGASWEFHAEIIPDLTVARGASNTVLVTATSLADGTASDTVKLITLTKTITNAPQGRTFTTDDDFEEGTPIGTVAVDNQLELSAASMTPPYLWVPNSAEGTVSKVDIRTGKEVGRYRTGPPSAGSGNPSRTTVDQYGNCWVANRNHGTIVKIGLYENGQYLDRNGDGLIQTSQDLDNDGNIAAAETLDWGKDECVLWEVVIIPGREGAFTPGAYAAGYGGYNDAGSRSIAADAWGNVWAGNFTAKRYYFIDNSTGQILRTNDLTAVNHTPYGAVVDAQGYLWSASAGLNHVLRLNPADDSVLITNVGHIAYGLGLDRNNRLFVSGWQSSALSRFNVLTGEKEWTRPGIYESRGVAVTPDGDVWVANSGPGTVARWSNDGVLKTTIAVGSTPTGVSIDSEGKVWVVNLGDGLIRRIDPDTDTVIFTKQINALGGGAVGHYGYSDMTGNVARNATVRYGQWLVIHDAQVEFAQWGAVTWQAYQPAGSNLTVRVRSSQDQKRWSNWETAPNGTPLGATPPGRYLQVEVALWALAGQDLPLLHALTVAPLDQRTADLALGLEATPAAVTNEQQITYTTMVTNLGPADARGVLLTNRLPVGAIVASVSNSLGTVTQTSGEVRCEIGTLPAGSNVTLILVVDVTRPGNLTNLAGVLHYEKDLAPQNNLAVSIVPAAAIACLPPPADLVGWWPGEGTGNDLAGTNHGSLVGPVTFVPGRVGQAFSFDGSSAWVNLGRVSPGSRWTLEAWIKPSSILSGRRVIMGCHADCRDWSLLLNNGEIGLNIGRGGCVAIIGSGITAVTGVWYHLVGSCDGTNAALYVNGQLSGSGPVDLNYVGSASSFRLGSSVCCGEYYAGLVDEAGLYSRALTGTEALALYEARGSGKCKAALQPPLNIGSVSGGGYAIWWTTEAVGFRLVSSPTLGGPWTAVSPDPVAQGTNWVVPVSVTEPARFFRLRTP